MDSAVLAQGVVLVYLGAFLCLINPSQQAVPLSIGYPWKSNEPSYQPKETD